MESFIFNNFKKRLMEGEVNENESWIFYPVNKSFVNDFEDKIKYIKSTNDFRLFLPEDKTDGADFFDTYKTRMYSQTYRYTKMGDTDIKSKPYFVTSAGFDLFLEKFPGQEHLKDLFFTPGINFYRVDHYDEKIDTTTNQPYQSPVPRGFYYVNTTEELAWCADQVNNINGDNTINIVLGDNIGVKAENVTVDSLTANPTIFKTVRTSIGSNPAQPYEGIFYGNGFKFVNLILNCDKDVNGIFGYLGTSGLLSTVTFDGVNVLKCDKDISITHLINNGTDVFAGLLCGKNNGKIESCYIHGDVVVNNFIPKMYSSLLKNDNADITNGSYFTYYPNYYCYDNPGNIVPYIGYFNEGVFATYSGYGADGSKHYYWNTENTVPEVYNYDTSNKAVPLEWYYYIAPNINSMYFMHFTHEKCRLNVLWYDQNLISDYSKQYQMDGASVNDYGLYCINPEINNTSSYKAPSTKWMDRMKYAQYFNKSIKLSEQNRVAYYVSSLVGCNNSIINHARVDCTLHTSGTFVGFMGGVAGMQAKGKLYNIFTQVTSKDVVEDREGFTYYKRDWVNFNQVLTFHKKSIKNISSLFGSCIVDGKYGEPGLVMDAVNSYFNNENSIVFNSANLETPEYDDYYFDNRFGAFAAMVEFNASNVSDMWISDEMVNNPVYRCIRVSNSTFGYKEIGSYTTEDGTRYLCSPYTIAYAGVNGYQYNMYGIASPLFPEIKPIYNSTPSIISTCFDNKGFQIAQNSLFHRVGLFGIDQNIAAPHSNPNFWCINLETDLPGVGGVWSNDVYNYYYNAGNNGVAVPTSVVDRVNKPITTNFDIDVSHIASKLVSWNNCYINNNYNQAEYVFTTVKVPNAAQIMPAYFTTQINEAGQATGPIAVCDGSNTTPGWVVGTNGTVYDYAANKVLSLYPYFGSDLALIENTDPALGKTDLTQGFRKIRLTLSNRTFNAPDYTIGTQLKKFYTNPAFNVAGHFLINNVKTVIIEISEEALKYRPFTDVPVPGETRADKINKVKSMISVYANTVGGMYQGRRDATFDYLPNKFRDDWLGKYDRVYDGHPIEYGFRIYTDYTDEDYPRFETFVIPYDIEAPYSISNDFSNPPYSTFEGFYVRTRTYGDGNYSDNSHEVEAIYPYNTRIYLEIENVELIPWVTYFHGFDIIDNIPVPIYTEEHSTYITDYLTAAWYGKDPADSTKYCFLTPAGEPTYDINEAKTGYFPKNGFISTEPDFLFMDKTRKVTAADNQVYQCYGPYSAESVWIQHDMAYATYNPNTTIRNDIPSADRFQITAVPLQNIPPENYNWESHFDLAAMVTPRNKVSYSDVEYYTTGIENPDWMAGIAYNYTLTAAMYTAGQPLMLSGTDRSYTLPTPWWQLECKGYFYNNLADSLHVNDPQLINGGENYTGYNTSTFGDVLLLRNSNIIANINASNETTKTDKLLNYYKYTYTKYDSVFCNDIYTNGIKMDVSYNYKNNKAGFWYKVPNTSGNIEFNDELNYYSNVFAIGKTLNQKSILDNCFTAVKDYTWLASGFSADDFEGIYVADTKGNSIMYIDVGLGECPDGTSWSLSSYPSEQTLSDNVSGLLLEVN